jgi:FkbM family methyltransferase
VAASIEHDRLPMPSGVRTVVDVGANRGQFALYSRVRFPAATIYCFEPLRAPREKLQWLFAGDAHVRVFPVAAGSALGVAAINVSRQDDSSSLLAETALQSERFPGTEMVGVEEIEVTILDAALEGIELAPPILLKLDVQGFELEALRGAGNLLRQADVVLCECSFVPFYEGQPLFEDIVQYLRQAGFKLASGALSSAPAGRWEQGDFLFEKPALPGLLRRNQGNAAA